MLKARRYLGLIAVVTILVIGGVLAALGLQQQAYWLLGCGALITGLRLAIEIIQKLAQGRVGVDILALAAIVSTLLVGEYWAAAVIILMLTGGEALETYATNRAKKELTSLINNTPLYANLLQKDKAIKRVPINTVEVGMRLIVRPGETIPVDGILESDGAVVDESTLTGESLPVTLNNGAELLSGAVNASDAIVLKVLRPARDSQYQKIVALVASATESRAPFVRLADKYAVPFTIVSFLIAGFAWWVSGEPVRFAEVLVLATPCPLLLATPIALMSGMSRSAREGIIVKSGETLEKLARIKAVAFDKTGTLTRGIPTVKRVRTIAHFEESEVLQYAASAEQSSLHTLAYAIVKEATHRSIKLSPVGTSSESVGRGVSATIAGHTVVVGKPTYLQEQNISIAPPLLITEHTSVYIAVDTQLVGVIEFEDSIREESVTTVRNLQQLGVRSIMMLTGDTKKAAIRIARQLDIHEIHADLLPQDKVRIMKHSAKKPILMVGDGINDAPVLAAADVGMAMGARGASAATETAGVVILVEDIRKSWQSIYIARHTLSVATQGMIIGIGLSIALMLIATTGAIPAIIGAALQEVIDVIVIFNALRVHIMNIDPQLKNS